MLALTGVEQAGLLVGVVVIAAALVYTARLRPPAMVTMAVSILTLALLAAWVADPERADNLIPLIGVGLGALASALSALFDPDRPHPRRPPDPPSPVEESEHE